MRAAIVTVFVLATMLAFSGCAVQEEAPPVQEDTPQEMAAPEVADEAMAEEEMDEEAGYMDVTPAEAKKLIDENPDLIILDVSAAWDKGHIPGSINHYVGDGSLDAAIPTFDPGAMYLVYCHVDSAAIAGAQKLVDAGFENVYRLEGNYSAWVEAGYEVEVGGQAMAEEEEMSEGPGYMDITAAEAKKLIDENPDLIILDVSAAYDEGHIPGAVNYSVGDGSLDAAIPNLDPEGMYLVYCHFDSAAIAGAQKLVDAGFENVYRLEGNYSAWVEAGYDVEVGEQAMAEEEEMSEGPGYMDITPAEAKKLIEDNPDLIILDVSAAWDKGHIPGAINYYVGDGSLDAAIPTFDPESMYLVYCHVDSAAIAGAQKLVDAGFENVYRLEGNYSAWVEAGYEVEVGGQEMAEEEEMSEGSGYMDITAAEAKMLIEENPDLIILDVSAAWDKGHIPGAINHYVGDGSLDAAIPTFDPGAMYLVYCHVDSAAIAGAQKLVDAGFENVYRLEGNYSAWVEAGYEVEVGG